MKKILALILSLVMAFSVAVIPASAIDADIEDAETVAGAVKDDATTVYDSAKDVYDSFAAEDYGAALEGSFQLAVDLVKAIHTLVHSLSEMFDFNCPFCDGDVAADDDSAVEEDPSVEEDDEPTSEPVLVESAAAFVEAMKAGEQNIVIENAHDIVLDSPYNAQGADVTFNGGYILTSNKNYTGIQHCDDVTYNDVTITGGTFLYGDKVVFNNCTINLTTQYIWTYGAKTVEFNNCTFNTNGKAILVYTEGTDDDKVVTVRDCTFNATQSAYTWNGTQVAAVSIDGSLPNGGTGSFTVNFEGTNVVDSDFAGLCQIKAGAENVTVNY